MEMKFREAGHSSELLEFDLAIQILAKIVDDPINSLGIFSAGPGLLAWHGVYRHCGVEVSEMEYLPANGEVHVAIVWGGLSNTCRSG